MDVKLIEIPVTPVWGEIPDLVIDYTNIDIEALAAIAALSYELKKIEDKDGILFPVGGLNI